MGIYDREYYRDEPGGFHLRKPGTIIGWIILINVVVYLADGFMAAEKVHTLEGVAVSASHPVNDALALHASDLTRPWLWWRLLTYGFAHDSYPAIGHILFNMLGLFFLGPPIEQRYGKREFLRLYLALIVFSGLIWASVALLRGVPPHVGVVGASGAVVGVVLLFALNYPRQTVYLYMLFPVPAWVIGVVIVLADLYGALNPARGMHIAVEAHLAGAALAILYWRLGWNFTRLTDKLAPGKLFKRRPRLKVHRPDDSADAQAAAIGDEVDRILEKIHREGEASLTRKERRTLQDASRRFQEKHRDAPLDE